MTRVALLGTGSADGWPNPFCRCSSCEALRHTGQVRAHSAALVDDTLLVDLGPDVPRSAERHGIRLDGVRVVLLTHAHPDHLAPLALLARHWADPEAPLVVAGPAAAVAECRPWLSPGAPVDVVELGPGQAMELAGYHVEALAARHEGASAGPALLYLVTTPDGARLLYATDTGPLPEDTYRALAGSPLDLLLLDLTFGDRYDHGTDHLDLHTFPAVLARLRNDGAITPPTEVVATHLSHHNPPDLAELIRPWGAAVHPDGAVLEIGPAEPGGTTPSRSPRRTLVLGGARSGKSWHAERLLAAETGVMYVATGGARPDDAEWLRRVTAHRERRPSSWATVETTELEALLRAATDDDVLLVDCLTLWLAALLDTVDAWDDQQLATDRTMGHIEALAEAWRTTRARVVAVSNEVGWGVVPATSSGRVFRDLQGRLNAQVARHSDVVQLVVAGRVLDLGAGGARPS